MTQRNPGLLMFCLEDKQVLAFDKKYLFNIDTPQAIMHRLEMKNYKAGITYGISEFPKSIDLSSVTEYECEDLSVTLYFIKENNRNNLKELNIFLNKGKFNFMKFLLDIVNEKIIVNHISVPKNDGRNNLIPIGHNIIVLITTSKEELLLDENNVNYLQKNIEDIDKISIAWLNK